MSSGLAWGNIADCATVISALMGAWVAYNPPARSDKLKLRLWFAAFGIVAIFSVIASGAGRYEQDKQFENATSGGDNYAYVKAEIINPKNVTDPVPLSINSSGHLGNVSFWIAPATSKWPDPAYGSVDTPRSPVNLNKGGFVFGKLLGPGKYRVEFSASNGTFSEYLTIEPSNGIMSQYFYVCRGSERLMTFPKPFREISTCN